MAVAGVPGVLSRPARPELLLEWLTDALVMDDPICDWVRGLMPEELDTLDRQLVHAVANYLSRRNQLHRLTNACLAELAPAGRSEES